LTAGQSLCYSEGEIERIPAMKGSSTPPAARREPAHGASRRQRVGEGVPEPREEPAPIAGR